MTAVVIFDSETTCAALERTGATREANPFMRPLVSGGRKVAYPIGFGVNALLLWRADKSLHAGESPRKFWGL